MLDTRSSRIPGVTFSDEVAIQPRRQWLVHGAVPSTGIGFVQGNVASIVAHALAISVATGTPVSARKAAPPSLVAYLPLEFPEEAAASHVAWRRDTGAAETALTFVDQDFNLLDKASVASVAQRLSAIATFAKRRVALLVLDTWEYATSGLDETSTRNTGLAVTGMRALQAATGGCVMAAVAADDIDPGSHAHATADFVLSAQCFGSGMGTLNAEKLRHGVPSLVSGFKLEPTTIEADDGTLVETELLRWSDQAKDAESAP